MEIINLRDYYPFYNEDTFAEVTDEVAAQLRRFELDDAAHRIRSYRAKAYYPLDRGDGIECEAIIRPPTPESSLTVNRYLFCSKKPCQRSLQNRRDEYMLTPFSVRPRLRLQKRNIFKKPLQMKALKEVLILRISRAQVYNLLNSRDFPTLHIGSRLMVSKENLLSWIMKNTNNHPIDTFDREAVSC